MFESRLGLPGSGRFGLPPGLKPTGVFLDVTDLDVRDDVLLAVILRSEFSSDFGFRRDGLLAVVAVLGLLFDLPIHGTVRT